MFKFPLQHQKKQKILNYEIKLIEECSDSLFNSKNCKHQRYLDWELCSVLEDIIKHQQYHLRWIGNDPNAYVYAYFYTAIVACSSNPSYMVELKCVLYQLAERYLCIYEKKLLIQFLCLIEYSQQKYLFFRKYSKIESILLKLFKQLEERSPISKNKSNQNSEGQQCNGKQTQSLHLKCKQIHIYQMYNTYFYFFEIFSITDNLIAVTLCFNGNRQTGQFYFVMEKECFFVVEIKKNNGQTHQKPNKTFSNFEKPKEAFSKLNMQTQPSKPKNHSKLNSTKKRQENQFTPKFISSRKKDILSKQFYDDEKMNKKVQIQILDIKQFNHLEGSKLRTSLNESEMSKNVDISKKTIQEIEMSRQRENMKKQIANHPLFREFVVGKKITTDQTIKQYGPYNTEKVLFPKSNQNIHKKNLIRNEVNPRLHTEKGRKNPQSQTSIKLVGPKIGETPLSAANLKRFNNRTNARKDNYSRPFHSQSPRNRIIQYNPTRLYDQFYSPRKDIKGNSPSFPKHKQIKFTYC